MTNSATGLGILIVMVAVIAPVCLSFSAYEEYLHDRSLFFEHENTLSINAAWELTPEEKIVDGMLQRLKNADWSLDPVPVQFSFVSMREVIDDSKLYSFIQTVPKGALLHSHDVSSQDMQFYVEMSYMEGCLYNVDDSNGNYGALTFRPTEHYVPISTVRNSWEGGAVAFDAALYLNFTITQFEGQAGITGDFLWDQFQPIFGRLHDAYQYEPVFRQYYRRMFSKLLDDGVLRWEIRTSLEPVYDSEREYSQADAMAIIVDELRAWQNAEDCSVREREGRKAFSFGVILQGVRSGTPEEVTAALESAYALRAVFPELVLGFDLVGHEDPGQTLLYWAPTLIEAQERLSVAYNASVMPFFFHAGESNRVSVQDNLVDAVLLNTSRIGHGFGIQGYPSLWPLLNERRVLIESCPISNQLLGMVVDQRNHPVGQMLHHALLRGQRAGVEPDDAAWRDMLLEDPNVARVLRNNRFRPGLAVAISNDDPGFWGIDAVVSYDWYVAVLGWDLSLAGVKQVAVDSIVRSAAPAHIRVQTLLEWERAWNEWVALSAARS
jgi:adenosine deaminase CECR1